MRVARLLLLVVVFSTLAAPARATPTMSFHVRLRPDVLGRETSVTLEIYVHAGHGELVPPPLTGLDLVYPSSIGLAVSGLGLSACSERALELRGPKGCASDAVIGRGSVLAAFPIEDEVFYEHADAQIVRSPEPDHIAMYFNVEGWQPVESRLVLPGLLAPTGSAGYEQIELEVPLVEAVAGSDVSVTRLQATLGPRNLTYYEHVHGKYVAYRPRGILLPRRCPSHGFEFSASLSLLGAGTLKASARAPCGTRS